MGYQILKDIYEWLWTESFWLPPNTTWNQRGANYPKFADLKFCIPVIGLILLLRLAFREFVMKPIAKRNGIKFHPYYYKKNPLLEEAYLKDKKNFKDPALIHNLAVQLHWNDRRVDRWFRNMERANFGGTFKKLCESGWKLVAILFLEAFNVYANKNDNCIWNLDSCIDDFANFKTSNAVWWFTIFEISFNSSLLLTHFSDIKFKDSLQMIIHHIVTIATILLVFLINGMRVGSLFLLCIDVTEIPFELAKVLRYLKKMIFSEICFMIFFILWFTNRVGIAICILFPKVIDKCFQVKPNNYLPCYIGIIFGWILTALHIYWTWLILLGLKRFIIQRDLKDIRSESEDSDEDKTNEKSD